MKLVILDRDGTINVDREEFVKSARRMDAAARRAGSHRPAQPCRLARGDRLQPVGPGPRPVRRGVAQRHARQDAQDAGGRQGGRIDAVFYCPHSPDEGCECRKPMPGLFEQISERFGVDLEGTPAVGDSLRDLQAGAAVGCEPHLRADRQGRRPAAAGRCRRDLPAPDTRVHDDLAAFAEWLIARGTAAAAPEGWLRLTHAFTSFDSPRPVDARDRGALGHLSWCVGLDLVQRHADVVDGRTAG